MLLFIDACIRGRQSRTKAICEHFLSEYKRLNPNEPIERAELADGKFRHLTHKEIDNRDEAAAKQFARADKILIGAPYWDFSFPAALKCYIEHICVRDVTFKYCDKEGLVGLCKASKLLYICTAGGPIIGANSGFAYIEELGKGLLGIKEFIYIDAQELDIIGKDVNAIISATKDKAKKAAGLF